MNLYLEINGIKTPSGSFILPDMNLSSARDSMQKEEFSLCINKTKLIKEMSSEYIDWVKASKDDDFQCGSPQDELAEANYPPIEKVVENPKLTELVFGSYLIRELFVKLIKTESPLKPYHWLDEITDCKINEAHIQFNGICYKKE